jgi:hypothetical protein
LGCESGTVGTSNSLLPSNQPQSISAWIYPRSAGAGGAGRIAFRDSTAGTNLGVSLNFYLSGTNAIEFGVDGTVKTDKASSNNTITLNKWNHVVATWDGGTSASNIHIFINGTESTYQVSSDGSGPFDTSGKTTRVGNRADGTRDFDGIIDDVRIYNHALSDSEVKQLYNLGTAKIGHSNVGISNGLVGYWTFDGGSIDWHTNTVADMSGQGNTGSLVSMSTTSSPVGGKIGQAFSFNGSNQSISNASLANAGTSDFTATGWIKLTVLNNPNTDGEQTLVSNFHDNGGGPGWLIDVINNGQVRFIVRQSVGNETIIDSSAGIVSAGNWYYLTAVRNGANTLLYVNGILLASGTGTVWDMGSETNLRIGQLEQIPVIWTHSRHV